MRRGTVPLSPTTKYLCPVARDKQRFPENPNKCVHPEVPTGPPTEPLWQTPSPPLRHTRKPPVFPPKDKRPGIQHTVPLRDLESPGPVLRLPHQMGWRAPNFTVLGNTSCEGAVVLC